MALFRIHGRKKLNGSVEVMGSKNAFLPQLAATLLTREPCILRRVPRIRDGELMIDILVGLGAKVQWKDEHTLRVDCSQVSKRALSSSAVVKAIKSIRASILLVAPLLARLGTVNIPEPGGCIIGKRPLSTHFFALERLGATIRERANGQYRIATRQFKGTQLILPEFSVTATENALMAASAARGGTTIHLAAEEPHVVQLCQTLKAMGASVRGIGTHHLVVAPARRPLKGFDVDVIPDELEAMTFAIAGVLTNGKVAIHPVVPEHLELPLQLFSSIGIRWKVTGSTLTVSPSRHWRAFRALALPFPGLPSDIQALFALIATRCRGTSLIHDPLFEGRMGHVNELMKMGANMVLCDPHRVLVTGPTPLVGTEIRSLDLRCGATLIIAGLCARGETIIHDAQIVDRGYERIDERFRALGADIQRVE